MELKKYKLSEVAKVEISSVDKKTKENETLVRLCNFTDVYHNWAITMELSDKFMTASANSNEIAKFSIKKGQVAFTKDSETRDDIGIPTYIADDFDNVLLGYHCALITPDESKVCGKYLNAFMHSDYIQKYFENSASGSGQRYTLSLETIEGMPLLLPSLEKQKTIGELFSSLDRKIALNRAINRNLEALAKQLYDYWFVQFDFPDEHGRPYKSSGGKMVWNEVLKREIPVEWEVKSVNDVSSICRGVSYKPNDLQESGVLILRGNNIENNHVVYDNNTAYLLPDMISDEQKIKKHDIIITMSSGSKEHIGKCAMFQKDSEHSFGAFLSKITPQEECPYFLFLYLSSLYFKQKIKSICNGTGINNLTNQTFDEVKFAYPTKSVLLSFERSLQPIFDMIGINESEINTLTRKRDELLPLLMNGQVTIE